jgi:hypothetical protein
MESLKSYGGVLVGVFALGWVGSGVGWIGEKMGLSAPWWAWSILLGISVTIWTSLVLAKALATEVGGLVVPARRSLRLAVSIYSHVSGFDENEVEKALQKYD